MLGAGRGIAVELAGLAPAQADARYVRRFVDVAGVQTLAADTYLQSVSAGSEAVLSNPSGPLHGLLGSTVLPALLTAGDGGRFGARVRVLRSGTTPIFQSVRVNTSLDAPTAVLSADSLLGLVASGYDGSSVVGTAEIRALARENFAVGAGGTLLRFFATPIGSSTQIATVDIRATAGVAEIAGNQATARYIPQTLGALRNPANTVDLVSWNATGVGFQGTAPIAKPTVTGAKGGNAALTSLLTQLAAYGLITDSTT